jgi:hypothetical protein
MALSSNVVINFLTKFDKKGLERATKDLKGFDKVVATGAFRLKSAFKLGAIAAGTGLLVFAKNSIEAALAQEKLDKQLQLSLRTIGEEFSLPSVKSFIADLQKTTNVTEDQLVPALRQLIAQTGDLQTSQVLLGKALDISSGTGAELNSVLDAITKAAVGNFTSIGKLGLGFTAAEAKAMGFVELMINLDKYAGAAEDQTQTFAGQLKSFQISAGEATETLGQGFLLASSYIVTGEADLTNYGAKLEVIAQQFADIFVGGAKESSKGLAGTLEVALAYLEPIVGETGRLQKLEEQGRQDREKRILQEKGLYGLSGSVLDALEKQGKSQTKQLTYAELLKKIQADILKREEKLNKVKAAQAALDKKKAELESMFDIDRINLQAALSRKLSGEDELRVKILQKLADGTKAAVDEAAKYADVLKVIEDGKITTAEVEMLAKKWGMTTVEVLIYLQQLFLANEELRKMLALLDEISKKKMPTQGTMFEPGYFQELGTKLVGTLGYQGMTSSEISAERYKESGAARRGIPFMAEGGIVSKPTIAMIGEAGAEAVIPLDRMGSMGTKVVVNVQGSVISEGQLQSVIQDVLYNLNRTGAVTQLANLGR